MTYFLWVLVGWFAMNALGQVMLIGKERKPTEPAFAALSVLVNSALIVFTVLAATGVWQR